ncbi:MAG: ankyrin repeat domain-containing protein, partial [Oligoflexales bacterium]|nr:ankyrin repeat domain-containing protein [Oligoflexales bacterium]
MCRYSLILQKGGNINLQDEKGYTPLFYAFLNPGKKLVSYLLEEGASPSVVFGNGRNLLHEMTLNRDMTAIQTLLDLGLSPNVKTRFEGATALHLASEQGFLDIMKLLISKEADMNERDLQG